jgi:type II secretory ATPase GspE/PulE/Tfp pilus assembly ATPase PilB-like protein
MVGLKPDSIRGRTINSPQGCRECKNVGYRGRMGVYELLEMNPLIRELTFAKASSLKIRAEARQNGMSSLMDDGVRKVLDGKTTIEEVLTIAHREDI